MARALRSAGELMPYGLGTIHAIAAVGSLPGRAIEDASLSASLASKLLTLQEIEKALRTPEIIDHMTQRVLRSVKRHAPRNTGRFRGSLRLAQSKGVTRLIMERRSDDGEPIASAIRLAGDDKTFYSRRVYPAARRAKKQAVTRAAKWYAGDKRTQRQIKRLLIPRKRVKS